VDAAADAGLPNDGSGPDGGIPGLPACSLLTNGDAENGNLDGWSIAEGDFEAAQGGGQTPTPYSGAFTFFAGQAAASELTQVVDVSAHAEALDTGAVYAVLEAYVHDGNGTDASLLRLTALDALGVEVATVLVGPYHLADWAQKRAALRLPTFTRGVRVGLRGERSNGQDNDAYFDQVDLCLTTEPPAALPADYAIPPYLTWPLVDDVLSPYQEQVKLVRQEPALTTADKGARLEAVRERGREPFARVPLFLAGMLGAALIAWALGWAQGWVLARLSERISADPRGWPDKSTLGFVNHQQFRVAEQLAQTLTALAGKDFPINKFIRIHKLTAEGEVGDQVFCKSGFSNLSGSV